VLQGVRRYAAGQPAACTKMTDASRRVVGRPIANVLLACGAISSILYVLAIDVVAALRHPGYHNYTSQMVSELFAVGAPTRNLLIWLNIPYNLLVFLFAAGVWAAAGTRRPARLLSAALAAYGAASTAGLLLFPMDLRGTVDSQRDPRHIALTIVMSIFIVAAMGVGAYVHGLRFRLYTFATIVTVVGFGGLAGFLARPMPAATPGLGLAERVNIYATMLWFAALGISLWRIRSQASSDNSERTEGTTRVNPPPVTGVATHE
jgi:Protein of unknown function (DUF998)